MILINKTLYKIVYDDDGENVNLSDINEMIFGKCDPATCTIYIHNSLPKDKKKQTLIHELTHAYMYEHIPAQSDSYDAEYIADFVSMYGSSILSDAAIISSSWE